METEERTTEKIITAFQLIFKLSAFLIITLALFVAVYVYAKESSFNYTSTTTINIPSRADMAIWRLVFAQEAESSDQAIEKLKSKKEMIKKFFFLSNIPDTAISIVEPIKTRTVGDRHTAYLSMQVMVKEIDKVASISSLMSKLTKNGLSVLEEGSYVNYKRLGNFSEADILTALKASEESAKAIGVKKGYEEVELINVDVMGSASESYQREPVEIVPLSIKTTYRLKKILTQNNTSTKQP